MNKSTSAPEKSLNLQDKDTKINTTQETKFDINDLQNDTETLLNESEPFKRVYIPTWHNKPLDLPPVLMLGDCNILTFQNISSIIAKQLKTVPLSFVKTASFKVQLYGNFCSLFFIQTFLLIHTI